MNIASIMTRRLVMTSKAIARNQTFARRPALNFVGKRMFSEPVAPAGKYNVIQRKGHGLKNYLGQWEALIFCHKDWKVATVCVWGSSLWAVVIMFYCIWNSACRDPEARFRPHKKSWHITESRLNNAEKYRGGSMIWYPGNRKRQEFVRQIQREGLQVAGFEEPGQIGWEELRIPKLDEEPQEEETTEKDE